MKRERQPNKIPILKDCLNKLVQKQAAIDDCHHEISYLTPSILHTEGVPKKDHTYTDLVYCTETGYGRNIKLQSSSPPTPAT